MRSLAGAGNPARASDAPVGSQRRREELTAAHAAEKEKSAQADLIRKYYLGNTHQKRKLAKASDKFKCVVAPTEHGWHPNARKDAEALACHRVCIGLQRLMTIVACRFNFEWDAKEDTYEAPLHEGSILFGRGVRGGVDHRAQREAAAQHEQSYLSQMRKARGEMTSAADVAADLQRAQRAALVDNDPVRCPFCA